MRKERWKTLIEDLKDKKDLVYKNNPGNAGDALIYLGMARLFEDHGITFRDWEKKLTRNSDLIYSGGGNLVEYYDYCHDFIEAEKEHWASFTLLPHTVNGHEDLLSGLPESASIYVREKESFDYCKKQLPAHVALHCSHDFALYLNQDNIKPKITWLFPQVSLVLKLKWAVKVLRALWSVRVKRSSLFRDDCEATGLTTGNNYDLSERLSFVTESHAQRVAIAETFLKILSHDGLVETNRLHVGLARHILDLPCNLYPGSYHKNASIFEHSLAGQKTSLTFKTER